MCRDWREIPEAEKVEIIAAARQVREETQASWASLARAMGVSRDALRINCSGDPSAAHGHILAQRARRRQSAAQRFSILYGEPSHHVVTGPRLPDIIARKNEIPEDCRDLTARLFGDPIPNDPRRRQRAELGKEASRFSQFVLGEE